MISKSCEYWNALPQAAVKFRLSPLPCLNIWVKFFAPGIHLEKVLKSSWVKKLLFFVYWTTGDAGDRVGVSFGKVGCNTGVGVRGDV